MKDPYLLAILLAQLAVIIALSRVMGMLAARLRQPQVIGEIVAGILLGPTLLGWAWPWASQRLFPEGTSTDVLSMVAQLGVVLFLFLVGLEFDPKILKRRGKSAAAISVSGIVVPFGIGFGATYALMHLFDPEHQDNPLPTALFMGAAMSVTAFPVLARIVTERNLQKTDEGGMAIAAAAVDDVLAWTMLAAVVAFVPGGEAGLPPYLKLTLAVVYVAVMLAVVRPFLLQVEKVVERQGRLSAGVIAVLMLTLLASSFATEMIGVHALFGAFVAGFVMPKGQRFVEAVTERLESFALVFLLPAFFAYAGLKADLRDVFDLSLIGYTVLIIALACAGKLGGCMIAARVTGMGWRSSFTLGVLMNTRGLMELIILTVGLKLGVINDKIYSMMVVMALVTTGMAAPLLQLLLPARQKERTPDKVYSVLIPVAKPESGGPLIELASYLSSNVGPRRIAALHLSRPSETELYRSFTAEVLHPAETEALEPLLDEARQRNVPVDPMSFYSRDVPSDIARVVRQQNIDLVLMGYHTPVFSRALLGGIVHRVMTGADCDVAVFVERGFDQPKHILVPFLNSTHDKLALELAGRVARATGAAITIVHVAKPEHADQAAQAVEKSFADPSQQQKVAVKIVHDDSPVEAVLPHLSGHDLVVIGVSEEWGLESSLLGLRAERIAQDSPTSMLIVRRHQQAV
jgi:Kef-type K+ transport system membrane component KefB